MGRQRGPGPSSMLISEDRAGNAVNTNLNLPILHLPQLLGLAMGIPPKDLGVSRHLVPVDSIVRVVEKRRAEQKSS